MPKRFNKKIRRRSDVIDMFLSKDSYLVSEDHIEVMRKTEIDAVL